MYYNVRVLVVEDDSEFVYLVKKMIARDERLDYIGDANTGALGIEMAAKMMPDIVVMDLNLSRNKLDGIEAAKEIRLTVGCKTLLLTSFEQQDIMISASKKAFASGYVFKSQCQTLADTIYKTATSITPQEGFIRELLLNELSSAERAVAKFLVEGNIEALSLSSPKTIANQKTNIFKKLGLKNTDELISVFKP